jgi:tetratricopeptide (TPR) repeat protein
MYLFEKNPEYLKRAEAVLNHSLQINSNFILLNRLLGELKILQGKEREADALLNKVYKVDNNLARLYEIKGQAFLEKGDKKTGVELIKQGLRQNNFSNQQKIGWVINTYNELKDYPALVNFYKEILSASSTKNPDPQLYIGLAMTYQKIGNREKAFETISRMIEIYPELWQKAEQIRSFINQQSY